jgi:hypothetical protein
MKTETLTIYKFSDTATEKPTLEISNPLEFLKSKYQRGCIFGLDNLQRSGTYKLMGWAYDFKPLLKKYIVKQYGAWHEYFAPNKTLLRRSIYGTIEKIVEIN